MRSARNSNVTVWPAAARFEIRSSVDGEAVWEVDGGEGDLHDFVLLHLDAAG